MRRAINHPSNNPISIRLPREQKQKLKEVSKKVRLSQVDTLRKALDFGLPVLLQTFSDAKNSKPLFMRKK